MRRFLIQTVFPLILCLVPFLAAFLVALATPPAALAFYLQHVRESRMDWLILGLGGTLFAIQLLLSWRALHWRKGGFEEGPDRWIATLSQAAEWFPLLGLLGTVTSILQTFSQVAADPTTGTQQIIQLYAPALTTTGSGLFMALVNILPAWMVLLGRDLIMTLGGKQPVSTSGNVRP